MHVDAAVEGLDRMTLERIHDLVAREDPAGAARHHLQDVELVAGQLADAAVDPHLAGVDVDLEPAEAQHRVVAQRRGAAQQRLDAREQLARLEGLGQVVVGAELQTDDAVHRLAARGQHQQRQAAQARIGAQLARQVQAVAVGQHQVEHQHVEELALQPCAPLREISGHGHLQTGRTQVGTDHAGQPGIVVDQEDSGAHGGIGGTGSLGEHAVSSIADVIRSCSRCKEDVPAGTPQPPASSIASTRPSRSIGLNGLTRQASAPA